MPNFSLRLPNSLQEDVRQAALQENISINQFIMLAVAEKITAFKKADRIAYYRKQKPVSQEEFFGSSPRSCRAWIGNRNFVCRCLDSKELEVGRRPQLQRSAGNHGRDRSGTSGYLPIF